MRLNYRAGRLLVRDVPFLGTPDAADFRLFVAVLFALEEVREIRIATKQCATEIFIDPSVAPEAFAKNLTARLKAKGKGKAAALQLPLKPDAKGIVRIHRNGGAVSTWRVASDVPGRLRVRNDRLFRRKKLCHDVERELMTVIGVERFKTSSLGCSILIHYDLRRIGRNELISVLDEILHEAEEHPHADAHKYEMLLCSGAVVLAAATQSVAPALFVPAALLFVYCVIPTFVGAWQTLFVEHRLGVDVLDSIVVILCLLSGQLFAGTVLAWCLAFGRRLLERAQEDSRRRLVNVFAKQARSAYLLVDGTEVSVPLDRVKPGDLVAVHTGEVIPVDGTVVEGAAVVDQHALTGESVPVEKETGSPVFASTLIVGGRVIVNVERAGKETTSAKITTILNETAMYRLASQSKGEALADKAVIPTLALAGLGYATSGLYSATAIINCDFGTGIRMAAPLALLSSLSVCANRGILVKDGRALEEMTEIDTVLFDKTGTLTKERPTVAKIHAFAKWKKDDVLTYAAAAERRLGHPIAAAIVEAFRETGKEFPETDNSSYHVGYGISVTAGEREVKVGSARFLRQEKIVVGKAAQAAEKKGHDAGNTIVYVAIDGKLAGAIELAPALRDGVAELIERLRGFGVRQVVIISGDHDKPTRRLAKSLGVDRYFAEVLPEEKAKYVELLQKEGRRVCFVGDGINDAIALKRANVSVSIRGATTVATDTAQVVFMEENLDKLGELMEISRALDRNVSTSWKLILAPNVACIAGAFFLGFGVMASVLANNVAAIAALANGLRPLRMYGPEASPALLSAAPRRRRSRRLAKASAVALLVAGVGGLVAPGIPGWPLILLSLAMLIPPERRPARLRRWLNRSFIGRHLSQQEAAGAQ